MRCMLVKILKRNFPLHHNNTICVPQILISANRPIKYHRRGHEIVHCLKLSGHVLLHVHLLCDGIVHREGAAVYMRYIDGDIDIFKEHLKQLRRIDIKIIPYINMMRWWAGGFCCFYHSEQSPSEWEMERKTLKIRLMR